MNLTTQGTQDEEKQTINNTTHELIMDNPMNLTTQVTQDEEKQIHNTINNGQPNEPDNIGYTRRRKTNTQHN